MSSPWLFAASTGLLIAFVALVTYRSGQLLAEWTPPANLLLGWPDNLLRLAMVGACLAVGQAWGPGPAALGWGTQRLRQDVLWGAVVGLLLAVLLVAAGWVVERLWGEPVHSSRVIRCILPANRREWGGVLLALLPAAALEELLFRSLPLGGVAAWLALWAPWALMWPLAVCFGLLHWPQGGWGVVGTALAAIALSLLFLATGSVWATLAAHYVFNVLQLAAARLLGVQPLRAP
jgi:membrane protease YdiL (CAAX protease family)